MNTSGATSILDKNHLNISTYVLNYYEEFLHEIIMPATEACPIYLCNKIMLRFNK